MIADAERAVALAGIMGGEETEVGDWPLGTSSSRRRTSNRPALPHLRAASAATEGSNRWEKGVDPHLAEQAAKLATQLIVETAGAQWVGHVGRAG